MSKYILREGVINLHDNNGTILYDVYRRKMMLVQHINSDDFFSMLSNVGETHDYMRLILQSLLEKNYIVDSEDEMFSIDYEKEFFI